MQAGRVKVTFRFPGAVSEIRFLAGSPEVGGTTEFQGRDWRMVRIESSRRSRGYDVFCEPVRKRRFLRSGR